MKDFDTIAAISTPPGIGGIGIIRVSGDDAIEIVNKIFKSPINKQLGNVKSHTLHYGHIIQKKDQKIIDEVLVSVMRQPHTYTKENIVEVNCHGGIVSTKKILQEVLNTGARLAEAGEFTKRAFLNGRIDLVQAEAIIDIINSKTNIGLESAVNQLEGSLSEKIYLIRKELLALAAHLQASVDFPEEDIEEISEENLKKSLYSIADEVGRLIETADMGKIIREGLNTVIIGKPNVGKSSLLNSLVRENRAIVTEVPGTTRDIIEEYINIQGVPLKIVDTAGIRETEDIVEKIGVQRSKELVEKADLVIVLLDGSRQLDQSDEDIFKLLSSKKIIVLINKSDLPQKIQFDQIKSLLKEDTTVISSSLKEGEGLEEVENSIKNMFFSGEINISDDLMITNMRHKDSLMKARSNIVNGINGLQLGLPIDIISIDVQSAIEDLGEIIGLTVSEEIVDQIFHEFCLGK